MSMVGKPKNMSKYETTEKTRKQAVGGVLASRLREKGWSVRDAADYLGVSRQRLYSVFADPRRARLWECAVAGIPACTPEIAKSLKDERRKKPKPLPRPEIEAPTFEIGDVVLAVTYAGIAEEDDEGWITGIRGQKDSLELQVKMPNGEDWFPIDDFNDLFMTNGKSRTPGI